MLDQIVAPLKFVVHNIINRDPRSPRRHPWRWCVFVLFDIAIRAMPIKGQRSGTLVVLVNRLGDAIVSRPLVQLLQSYYGDQGRFLVLGDENWRCLSDNLYADIPTSFINESQYTRSLRYRLAVNYRIRAERFERAICFMHHRLEMRDDALIYASGAPHSVVSSLPFYHLRWYPWLFDYYLDRMSRVVDSSSPYLERSLQLPPTDCDYPRRVPHVLERQRAFATALGVELEHQHRPVERPRNKTVLLNFGAKDLARQWPIKEWVTLAVSIAELGYEPCFVGGPAERGKLSEVWHAIHASGASDSVAGRISTLVGEVPFGELVDIFSEAACYIGPDTGTSHLAVHCGTPTVTILLRPGVAEEEDRFGDFFPYPDGYLKSPYRCVCTTKGEFRRSGTPATVRKAVLSAFVSMMSEIYDHRQ
jgi:ADP-heptose:LPS heptosyltransferase